MSDLLKRAELARRYFQFRVSRKLGRAAALADVADKEWEIAPAEDVATAPSLCLQGQFDKARTIEAWTTREVEAKRVYGGAFHRPAVKAWRLKHAMLYRGGIYCGRGEKVILPYSAPRAPARDFPVIDIDEGALAGSFLGMLYFGHWLADDAPLSLMARDYGEPISPTPPVLHAHIQGGGHIEGYVHLLDLPWRPAENARFRRLVVFEDEDFTPHKGARLAQLRERVAARLGAAPKTRRVFIKRGHVDKGARRFQNEEEVAAALARDGFDILDPSKSTVEEIAEALHGAELAAGLEGSHLFHAVMFLRRGGTLLAITPPDRFCTVTKRYTDHLGIRYAFMVGDPEEEGFSTDIDELRRTIDLAGASP